MIQEIAPHVFHNEFTPRDLQPEDLYVSVTDGQIRCRIEDGIISLPSVRQFGLRPATYLFTIDEVGYFMTEGEFEGFTLTKLSTIRLTVNPDVRFGACVATSLARWYQTNRYCGCCGQLMEADTHERMLRCPHCGNTVYPKICPVAIIGIIKDDKLLLTKYANRGRYNRYALVAGFCEFGEAIEQTIQREAMEETGLKVKNITYYGSQPWPLSDSLLFGFFCEVDGSDAISFNDHELDTTVWANGEDIPQDDQISLTTRMMSAFRQQGRAVLKNQ